MTPQFNNCKMSLQQELLIYIYKNLKILRLIEDLVTKKVYPQEVREQRLTQEQDEEQERLWVLVEK